eukprot:TRINITY_DN208_c0_g1_i1.p1 TRINITY_DN208_c0_g1~~TRINITY_DN208_c0_g1_i1.p1  ORF type:complete len:171 (+),score=48.68 TRINITY_DN208_c0_g1_i1:133-645(+)
MCIRDRYQRRVRGGKAAMAKAQQAYHPHRFIPKEIDGTAIEIDLISTSDSSEAKLSDFSGTVVVCYYTTWALGAAEAVTYMEELHQQAKGKATLLLVCAEGECSAEKANEFVKTHNASSVPHYLLKPGSPMLAKYFPFHFIVKDGVCVMAGAYDVEERDYKDWEGIAGLR